MDSTLNEEISDICDTIYDISAKYKISYEEILAKIKSQINYDVFMNSTEY